MERCTFRGRPVAEPDQWAGSIHEQEANEVARCAYCDTCEVTNSGDYCSDICEAAAKQDADDDAAQDLAVLS